MKKIKLLFMLMGVLTVFAATGCSSGSAANNLGRMIKDGAKDIVDDASDVIDGNQKGIYKNEYYGTGIKNNFSYSGDSAESNTYSGYGNAYSKTNSTGFGTSYGGGYANITP